MGENDFESAWAEGAALSVEEAIAYAQRGRGERKRAATGWGSLTPAERDVVRLVSEGLGNKDIAARLFVSPRTVQSHLTHVFAKLNVTSRMQLAHEAARRSDAGPAAVVDELEEHASMQVIAETDIDKCGEIRLSVEEWDLRAVSVPAELEALPKRAVIVIGKHRLPHRYAVGLASPFSHNAARRGGRAG